MKRTIGLMMLFLVTVAAFAQWAGGDIPAFHTTLPKGALPPLLPREQRTGEYFARPYQTAAYAIADAVATDLYLMPCYCRCDRALGHKSLHSCFEVSHGAVCSTCMSEAAYVYEQKRSGKTPQQIRAAIERGDWQEIDLQHLTVENVGQ